MAQIRDLLDENLDRLEQLYERGQTITGTPTVTSTSTTSSAGYSPTH